MDALWADDPAELGPFALRGRLGSGGMGVVYLGETADGRRAAVKVVHAHLTGDRAFRDRFAREIEVARRVVGSWTAQVLEADPDGPRPWLATEYVEGPSLEDQVARAGPLPARAVTTLAEKLAEALAALHASGVVHRDLKPSNVLLAPEGPRLIDFGIARALDATKITHTGHVIGTPAFMSPEQAAGDEAQAPSDVFSLASVVVFAATGSGPFGHTANPVAMLLRISQQEPSTDGVPDALRPHLQEALARDPAARPTAGEVARRLRSVQPTLVPPVGDPAPGPGPPGPAPFAPRAAGRGPLRWLLAASGVLVVAVLLVVAANLPVPAPVPAPETHAPQAEAPVAAPVEALPEPVVLDVASESVDAREYPGRVLLQDEHAVRVLDLASHLVTTTVDTGPAPLHRGVAVRRGTDEALVLSEDAVVRIDLAAESVTGSTPLGPFPSLGPFDEVLSLDERGELRVAAGASMRTVHPDDGRTEYAAGGRGVLSSSGHLWEPRDAGPDVGGISAALSPDEERFYVFTGEPSVVVVDTRTGDRETIPGRRPIASGVVLPTADGSHVVTIGGPASNHVVVRGLDGADVAAVDAGGRIRDMDITPDGSTVYATTGDQLLVVDVRAYT